MSYDVVVIGAGPAGMMTCLGLPSKGKFLLIDRGTLACQRDRNSPRDAVEGIGGAGLYSDGKFSFWPSGTGVWQLENKQFLRKSYQAVVEVLQQQNMDCPEFPDEISTSPLPNETWQLKSYPSYYLSLDQRLSMIESLYYTASKKVEILTQTQVIKIIRSSFSTTSNSTTSSTSSSTSSSSSSSSSLPKSSFFEIILNSENQTWTISTQKIIYCGGRFGPFFLTQQSLFLPSDVCFRRLEIGFRIEDQNRQTFFYDSHETDPKWICRPSSDLEYRTFCACKAGETVLTQTNNFFTVSGRADGPITSYSNIALNTRFLSQESALKIWSQLHPQLSNPNCYFDLSFSHLLSNQNSSEKESEKESVNHCHSFLSNLFTDEGFEMMKNGAKRLASQFPMLQSSSSARIKGPTLESAIFYITCDSNLLSPCPNLWIAGDSSGKFRGIVPSMISGYYAALVACDKNQF